MSDHAGGCPPVCACLCHADPEVVPDPGPHVATCAWADPDYLPAGFELPSREDTARMFAAIIGRSAT